MENFNQIESDILNKIKNVSDRSSYEAINTEREMASATNRKAVRVSFLFEEKKTGTL